MLLYAVYLRWDKYEPNVKCYWIEADEEAEVDKTKSKTKSEEVDYHVEVEGEHLMEEMHLAVSLDPRNIPGLIGYARVATRS